MAAANKTKDKISYLLEEIRIVLPGTEVFLAFQLSAVFANGFATLDNAVQITHLISLGFILLTVILLLIAPAYHRIAEDGKESERFIAITTSFLTYSMVSLIVGISIELWVIMFVILKSSLYAVIGSVVTFTLACLLWFVYPLYIKQKSNESHKRR